MIYYYIPDFFWHYNVNMKLLELINTEPQMFYDDFKIGAVFGNFPNCIWNGGRFWNSRYAPAEEQQYISNMFNSYNVPLRLTMTNNFIVPEDCYDRFANYIMENLNNGFNQVIVASPILEDYIREKYPDYPIIRSILSTQDGEPPYDDSDKYFMSVLNKHKNPDIEFLKSIKNKDKIEILVNEICDPNCTHFKQHFEGYARMQLYEDNKNPNLFLQCKYSKKFGRQLFYNNPYCITREKIKEIYEPMGFKHFKISGRGPVYRGIILDYAHYMVKPEWKEDFILIMLNALAEDN